MIRIRTPGRLHFGLLSLEPEGRFWPDRLGEPHLPVRAFGGVGLMVEQPGLELRVSPAEEWSAHGPLAERALRLARSFAETMSPPDGRGRPCRLDIVQAPPEHVGLGTGTQLGLAVAHGLARLWRLNAELPVLARAVGRGQRSSLGTHGFVQGGFLVEAGKCGETLSPLVARLDAPESFRILLVIPGPRQGIHGSQERQAFASLAVRESAVKQTDALCRLALLGMLPALLAGDCDLFGEALYDFNQRVGETFAPVQGGVYASEETAAIVAFLRSQGVKGTGQSSWGPTVFAIVADPEWAEELSRRVIRHFGVSFADVLVTRPANRGATLEESGVRSQESRGRSFLTPDS